MVCIPLHIYYCEVSKQQNIVHVPLCMVFHPEAVCLVLPISTLVTSLDLLRILRSELTKVTSVTNLMTCFLSCITVIVRRCQYCEGCVREHLYVCINCLFALAKFQFMRFDVAMDL